jgi:hypothetical protein
LYFSVIPTLSDPVPGFTDTYLGSLVATFGIFFGFTRVIPSKKDFAYDAIPSDVVVNSTLVIAKEVAMVKNSIKVFNQVSHSERTFAGSTRQNVTQSHSVKAFSFQILRFVSVFNIQENFRQRTCFVCRNIHSTSPTISFIGFSSSFLTLSQLSFLILL